MLDINFFNRYLLGIKCVLDILIVVGNIIVGEVVMVFFISLLLSL